MVSVFARSEQCADQPRNKRATQPHQGKKQQRGIKAIRGKRMENRTRQSDAKTIFESVSVKPLGNSIVRATTKPSAMMAVSEATVKKSIFHSAHNSAASA